MSGRRRRLSGMALVLVGLTACGNDGVSIADSSDSPQMMAAALREMVGAAPGQTFLVDLRTVTVDTTPFEALPDGQSVPSRSLTDAERKAIEQTLGEVGELRWIEDGKDWVDEEGNPTVERSLFLGVGVPTTVDDTGFVPATMYCGNLCATVVTHRLERTDSGWVVTGYVGGIAGA